MPAMAQTKRLTLAPDARDIARSILVLRGQRMLLDAQRAALYGVATRTLIQAVQRNRARFPADFMFQLNAAEWLGLRSQFVISKAGRGGRRYPPYAFTEQGMGSGPHRPLRKVRHSYPDREVLIEAWVVREYTGSPRGLDGQHIRWCRQQE